MCKLDNLRNLFLLFCAAGTLSWSDTQAQELPLSLAHDFIELPDPTADTLADWSGIADGLHCSFATIDRRYPKSVAPSIAMQTEQSLAGWKGERVAAQLLLWTNAAIADVQVDLSDFKTASEFVLPHTVASARFVRYVMTDEFAGGCGHRDPKDFASSLVADMLDDATSYNLEARKVRPVWVTVNIPHDAKPGLYQGQIRLKTAGGTAQELTLNLQVIDQTLPKAKDWKYHLDQWQHPSAVARMKAVPMWSDAHFEALKPVMQLLADAGQKVITTTLNKDPWHVQTYDPYADMISWSKKDDGTWLYDYTVFDRWVQFMMDLGIDKSIDCYSIVPWNNEIHFMDLKTNTLVNVSAKPGTAIFEDLWTPFLVDFVAHLRAKGWLEITNIATDERSREEMGAAFALLKKVSPELGVSYADNQKTYQRYPDSESISIAIGHPFSERDLKDRQARGLNTTFYVCCSDAFPNQFTFSDPAESAYLAWYAEAAQFDGMLRWAFNSWVVNPLQDSRFRTWPAGDTYLVYPDARSSIRYERMLEGIQDYEKIQLVKKQLKAEGNTIDLQRLEAAIQSLKSVERTASWNEDLNAAKRLLQELSVRLVHARK